MISQELFVTQVTHKNSGELVENGARCQYSNLCIIREKLETRDLKDTEFL